jgi:hypothetical protein
LSRSGMVEQALVRACHAGLLNLKNYP